jgi:hypothetical protein
MDDKQASRLRAGGGEKSSGAPSTSLARRFASQAPRELCMEIVDQETFKIIQYLDLSGGIRPGLRIAIRLFESALDFISPLVNIGVGVKKEVVRHDQ